MRLGLYGGTFDPIHIGHLILAEICREECRLDEVWFVVAGEPPHKRGERTSARHRLEMVRLAVAGRREFEVSELETSRPGPHYSFETLEEVRRLRPDDDLFFLIGADSLLDLPQWREPNRIRELARLVVVNRPGIDAPISDRVAAPDAPIFVEIPPIGVSSSDLRARLAAGRTCRFQIPRPVEAYIESHGLYRRDSIARPASVDG
jgi:nicotinate-nucleotide adenylyltransferase